MGRVQMQPHGNATDNIIGIVNVELLNADNYMIEAGDFIEYGVNSNDQYVVYPATDRFNIGGVSGMSYSNGHSLDVTRPYETIDSKPRLKNQSEVTYTVDDEYISAGDFIHITENNTVIKALSHTGIHGYAIDSGLKNESIRVKIPK